MTKQQHDFIVTITDELPHTLSINARIYIACQFALESNYGTSSIAMNKLNYCGMKKAHNRITTRSFDIDNSHFATYNSRYDCICDYLLWLCYYNVSQSATIDTLKRIFVNYCPEPYYTERIDKVYNAFMMFR